MKSLLEVVSFGGYFGDEIKFKVTMQQAEALHRIKIGIWVNGALLHQDDFLLDDEQLEFGYTVNSQLMDLLPNQTSTIIKAELITLHYYEEHLIIGEDAKEITVSVPESIVPEIELVFLLPVSQIVPQAWHKFVQKLSKVGITVVAKGQYGASISSVETKVEGNSYIGYMTASGILVGSGLTPVEIKVRDSRGRETKVTKNIYITPYQYPQISQVTIERCEADGTLNLAGTYAEIKANVVMTQLDNPSKVEVFLKSVSDEYTLLGNMENGRVIAGDNLNPNTAYNIRIKAFDGLNSSVYDIVLPSSNIVMHVNDKGNAVAFGCIATQENIFEISEEWKLGQYLLKKIYPVGSIYMNALNIDPSVIIGGTWEKIEGRFLLASSNEYPNGSTGGSSTHTQTLAEMPHHGHLFEYQDANGNWQNASMIKRGNAQGNLSHVIGVDTAFDSDWRTNQRRIGETGGSQPFSIMPPYIAVNVWKRIA